jgi:hypothetical protein
MSFVPNSDLTLTNDLQMENRNVLSQPDSSADAGCRRGLLRRLCSPCIGLRGRAMLSPYHDWTSGHKRHCPQWRRLWQPRGSPKRCSQSLQPDELGMGDNVPDMVCSRRSPENSRLDLPVGPVTMVSEKTGRVAEGGAGGISDQSDRRRRHEDSCPAHARGDRRGCLQAPRFRGPGH